MDKIIIALYLRLSIEDEEKSKSEDSNSILAQRILLTEYVKELMQGRQYEITEFCDDGYSGTNFDRPGIQALIKAAKNGEINMIIVKDFSRFGRDYLEVGKFLEYIFPILQIRFVSVNDNYDSDDKFGSTGGMSVALKNLVYGMYSADISKKIRSARDTRVRRGEFVGQFAPYGYKKNPLNRHELLIDEEVAWIVRRIFQMAADGKSQAEIARILNEEEIPTRYQYHRQKGDNFPDHQAHVKIKKWSGTAVRDIVTDEVYLGTLLWNRAKCGIDTNKKRVDQPREKWIIVENQHDAIISKELFDKANANIAELNITGRRLKKRNPFFICGYCGKIIQLRSKKKNSIYFCRSRTQQRENDCQKIKFVKEELENAVLSQARNMADMLIQEREIRKKTKRDSRKLELEKMLADSEKELRSWKDTKLRLYERYKTGKITKENYVVRMEKGKARLEELEQTISEVRTELNEIRVSLKKQEIPDEELATFSVLDTFDKERLKILIEKVLLYGDNAIEIIWKVDNPFQSEHAD